jgi:peptidoglycan/LPS O-acetylase OafA/YrhL
MTVPDVSPGTAAERIGALDGLRSSVLLIMAFHFSIEAIRGFDMWMALPVVFSGLLGVVALDVFFVLSGFLITGILLDTKGAPGYFRNFYTRRAFRILPLYYGFLVLYLLVLPRVVPWDPVAIELTPGQQAQYWLYFVNIGYGLNWKLAAFTGHYWSLSIEEQFYLLWPLLVFLCSRRQLWWAAIACLVLSPIIRHACAFAMPDKYFFFYAFTFARLDGLALGGLLAIAWRERERLAPLARLLRRAGLVGAVAGVVLIGTVLADLQGTQATPGWRVPMFLTASAWVAGAVVVTVLMGRGGWFRRAVESWPLRRVGVYSYALYVIHDPLAYVFDQFGWLHRPAAGASPGALIVYIVAMTAVCLGVAALSWHAFERPMLRFRPRQVIPPAAQQG